MSGHFTRREFVKGSLSALMLPSLANHSALAATTVRQRPDWDTFKVSSSYPSYVNAIRKMRANTNAADKNSWKFWTNVHVYHCPHGAPYFLAWHRGYLNFFEATLRANSGNSALVLPYWDYYKNPVIPAEFTDPSNNNPLYVARVNTNVTGALTLAPFSTSLTSFPRDTANAFEPSLEDLPHNPVHDIIGGVMTTMQSPIDPIFWLHHANIDRLWNAWVAAGAGRAMPSRTSTYWSGTFTYATSTPVSLPKVNTYSSRTDLGYFYQNEILPSQLPSSAATESSQLKSARVTNSSDALTSASTTAVRRAPMRPPVGNFLLTGMRATGTGRLSLGGVVKLPLNEKSVSAKLTIQSRGNDILQSIFKGLSTLPFGSSRSANAQYTTVQLILDDVRITTLGSNGGYFYKVYANLPDGIQSSATEETYLLGTVGAFQLRAAKHRQMTAQARAQSHSMDMDMDMDMGMDMDMSAGSMDSGIRLTFSATELLRAVSPKQISELTFSFVRVGGQNSPAGEVITVGEARLEVSNDNLD
jgi:tyrosinase